MSDVTTVQDLQTNKQHVTFCNEVITGKAGGLASGAPIDYAVNPVTSQSQTTLPKVLADLGLMVQTWTATSGGQLTDASQVFLNDKVGSVGIGNYYAWTGSFPKTVAPGTDPASASGYVSRTDALLRNELAQSNSSVLIAGKTAERISGYIDSMAESNSSEIISGEEAKIIADNARYFQDMRSAMPIRNFKEISKVRPFYLEEFRVVGQTHWDQAFADALDASNTYGNGIEIGAGNFTFASPQIWKFPTEAGKVSGAGIGKTILSFPNSSSGETQILLRSENGADWYDLIFEKMSLQSAHNGTLLKVGLDGFSDPLNCASFRNIAALNSYNSTGESEAIRLNYVVNSEFTMCRGNAFADGAGTNRGRGLNCRQAEFNVFNGGSYGNAEYGISFRDGVSFGNVFNAIDVENINYGIFHAISSGGRNTFVGGQFSLWVNYLIKSQAGPATGTTVELINPNISSTVNVIDTSNAVGVKISGVQWTPSTPLIPSSGTSIRNTTGRNMLVNIFGGSPSLIAVDGIGVGTSSPCAVIVKPWSTIAVTYSSAPTWVWTVVE